MKGSAATVAEHCLWFVDAAAAYLTSTLEQEVSLSVKFLWLLRGAQDPVLRTIFRSTNTKTRREVSVPRDNIRYYQNTAFRTILDSWPKIDHFSRDGLFDSWLKGEYDNAHRDWMSFYNSTCVVAIPRGDVRHALPVGFVCADSLIGKLDKDWVVSVLGSVSTNLYNMLGALYVKKKSDNLKNTINQETDVLDLPQGWLYDDQRLIASDLKSQLRFQKALDFLDRVNLPEQHAPVDSEHAAPQKRRKVIEKEKNEFVPDYDDLAYRDLDEPSGPMETLTEEDVDRILKNMTKINPDAADVLARRRS